MKMRMTVGGVQEEHLRILLRSVCSCARHKGVWVSGDTAQRIHFGIRRIEWLNSRPGRFGPEDRDSPTHCM